ncbi:hypothetical protein [Apilactobacillus xinyiensis]|uniref:hypothetical protein n=1 Tax=Apilactobacillus xinyiensis TaxID=2841032 RepID=UPI00336508FA
MDELDKWFMQHLTEEAFNEHNEKGYRVWNIKMLKLINYTLIKQIRASNKRLDKEKTKILSEK